MLSRVVDNRDMLREVTMKTGLERIDIQEKVTVEALLEMSSEFARK